MPEVATAVPPKGVTSRKQGVEMLRAEYDDSSGVQEHLVGRMFTPFLVSLLQGNATLGSNNYTAAPYPLEGSKTLLQLVLSSTQLCQEEPYIDFLLFIQKIFTECLLTNIFK